ncbi:hypothetical protein [Streptomyces nigrescens]|uniref:hypothetical protein n=1 Tax=Streptomyces nigrescens TaxID=1920 RepID=UPI0034770FF4
MQLHLADADGVLSKTSVKPSGSQGTPLTVPKPARAARAVVALDAVATLGSHGDGVVKHCEQRTCGGSS